MLKLRNSLLAKAVLFISYVVLNIPANGISNL
jgi:hypothetical protein